MVHTVKLFHVICQRPKTVFEHNSKHREESGVFLTSFEVRSAAAQRSILEEIRGAWIADETLSRVFDISSQSKQRLKRVNGEVKTSKSMLIKTRYPNHHQAGL